MSVIRLHNRSLYQFPSNVHPLGNQQVNFGSQEGSEVSPPLLHLPKMSVFWARKSCFLKPQSYFMRRRRATRRKCWTVAWVSCLLSSFSWSCVARQHSSVSVVLWRNNVEHKNTYSYILKCNYHSYLHPIKIKHFNINRFMDNNLSASSGKTFNISTLINKLPDVKRKPKQAIVKLWVWLLFNTSR